MPSEYKIIGQEAPAAQTYVAVKGVTSAKQTVISTLSICNFGEFASPYRVRVRPDSEAASSKHWLIYDNTLAPGNSVAITIGITLGANDIIEVMSHTGTLAFHLYGSVLTA